MKDQSSAVVSMADVQRINDMFDQLGQEIMKTFPEQFMNTHAGTARGQSFLRLQEAHMWFGNGIAFMQHMDLIAEGAADQAAKEGTIVNLQGGGNHGG